jgi:putative glutamine transport system permease protein
MFSRKLELREKKKSSINIEKSIAAQTVAAEGGL